MDKIKEKAWKEFQLAIRTTPRGVYDLNILRLTREFSTAPLDSDFQKNQEIIILKICREGYVHEARVYGEELFSWKREHSI